MRLKIQLRYNGILPFDLPLNYNYKLTANLYRLFAKSSQEYSEFLHNKGFIINGKHLKLVFHPVIDWYFSTIIDKSIEHIVRGIFADECIILNYKDNDIRLYFDQIISEPVIEFTEKMKFKCLSSINVNSNQRKEDVDYFRDTELFRQEDVPFQFEFLPEYLYKRQNRIDESIQYRKSDSAIIYIRGFFAPFRINFNNKDSIICYNYKEY